MKHSKQTLSDLSLKIAILKNGKQDLSYGRHRQRIDAIAGDHRIMMEVDREPNRPLQWMRIADVICKMTTDGYLGRDRPAGTMSITTKGEEVMERLIEYRKNGPAMKVGIGGS